MDHGGLGHHQGAALHYETCQICAAFLGDHAAPGLEARTCASRGGPEFRIKLYSGYLYSSLTSKVPDRKDFRESVVTNEGLMKLGPKLPDE